MTSSASRTPTEIPTEIRTAGPIAFGPGGVLFLADNAGGRIVAADLGDDGGAAHVDTPIDLDDIDAAVASLLGAPIEGVKIRGMVVHPTSQNVYLSVQRGTGDAGQAVLIRVDRTDGSLRDVPLADVPVTEVRIGDAPDPDDERLDTLLPTDDEGEVLTFGDHSVRVLRQPIRTSTVTDMSYVDGTLLVAGLSNEEFSSKLRRIPFPFKGPDDTTDTSLEIYHVSHGKWETASPIRRFVPYDGGRSVLATYTCTPLVHFSLSGAGSDTKTVGRTVADLGNMNQPLGMVAFEQDGEEQLLVSNSIRGLLKIAKSDIDAQPALTEPQQPVGTPRKDEQLTGISYLANLGADHVLALQTDSDQHQHLRSIATASL